jgi:hypothetical protein
MLRLADINTGAVAHHDVAPRLRVCRRGALHGAAGRSAGGGARVHESGDVQEEQANRQSWVVFTIATNAYEEWALCKTRPGAAYRNHRCIAMCIAAAAATAAGADMTPVANMK